MDGTGGAGGTVGVDKLRDEIIEAQRGHLDMVKWKIVLVAALGAVGLGFQGAGAPGGGERTALPAHYVLCLIPFVCAYCDLMLCTLLLRMHAIGAFIHRQGAGESGLLARYEAKIWELRSGGATSEKLPQTPWFQLIDKALPCLFSQKMGRLFLGVGLFSLETLAVFGSSLLFSVLVSAVLLVLDSWFLALSGVLGVIFTVSIWVQFEVLSAATKARMEPETKETGTS